MPTSIISKGRLANISEDQLEELRGKELSWLPYSQARLTLDHPNAVKFLTQHLRHSVRLVWREGANYKPAYTRFFEAVPGEVGDDSEGMLVFLQRDTSQVRLMHLDAELLHVLASKLTNKHAINVFVASVVNADLESAVRELVDQFENQYDHCGQEWKEVHSSMSNDRCPCCNKEIEPNESDTISTIEIDADGVWSIERGEAPIEHPQDKRAA